MVKYILRDGYILCLYLAMKTPHFYVLMSLIKSYFRTYRDIKKFKSLQIKVLYVRK